MAANKIQRIVAVIPRNQPVPLAMLIDDGHDSPDLGGKWQSEGVIHIRVAHRACRTRQEADVAVAIVAVEAGCLRCDDLLVLADAAISVG
jgi:hypothetical protein